MLKKRMTIPVLVLITCAVWLVALEGTSDEPVSGKGTLVSKQKLESVPRGRVIYNLDCSEFFVGTFGPIVPETIDKWVDAHAALETTVEETKHDAMYNRMACADVGL